VSRNTLPRNLLSLAVLITAAALAAVSWLVSSRTQSTTAAVTEAIHTVEALVMSQNDKPVYEQVATSPSGEKVVVRTYAGEAASEDELWALHKSRIARVKAG
jgi:type II secretory pathway pseudopilin PulG